MFKWLCLGVAVVALAVFGWMLNDMRLQVKGLVDRADAHLPRILTQADHVTAQLDAHLPALLQNSGQAAEKLNTNLPVLLENSRQAVVILDTQLPRLIVSSEGALDGISELSGDVGMYKSLMGVVHTDKQNKPLFSFGESLLSLVEKQPATTTIGLKKPGTAQPLKATVPAKEWATAARKDNQFLSLVSSSKAEVLHGLAKTHAPLAYHIQVGDQPPRPLADWLKEMHPDSKDVN